MNVMTLEGNLTADPELKFFPDGTPIAEFTVAYTPRHFNRERKEWVDGTPMFMPVIARGKLAEHIAESLAKGSAAIVTGPVTQENWEAKDGTRRSRLRLRADSVGVSLKFAPARSERVHGARPVQQGTQSPPPASGWDAQPQPAPTPTANAGGWGGDDPPF